MEAGFYIDLFFYSYAPISPIMAKKDYIYTEEIVNLLLDQKIIAFLQPSAKVYGRCWMVYGVAQNAWKPFGPM